LVDLASIAKPALLANSKRRLYPPAFRSSGALVRAGGGTFAGLRSLSSRQRGHRSPMELAAWAACSLAPPRAMVPARIRLAARIGLLRIAFHD